MLCTLDCGVVNKKYKTKDYYSEDENDKMDHGCEEREQNNK